MNRQNYARSDTKSGQSQYQKGTRKPYRQPIIDATLFYDERDGRKWRVRCQQKRAAWIALLDVGHGRVMVRATEQQMAALKHQSRRTFRRALAWLKEQGFFANVKKEGYHTGCLVRLLNPSRLGAQEAPLARCKRGACSRLAKDSEIRECGRSSTVESDRTSTSECGRVKAFKTLNAVGENSHNHQSVQTDDRKFVSLKPVPEKNQTPENPFCLEEDEQLIRAVRERLAKRHTETHKKFKLNILRDEWFHTAIEFIDDRGEEPIRAPIAYFATSIKALLVDSADDDTDLRWVNITTEGKMRRRKEFEKNFQGTLSFESEQSRQLFNSVPSPEQMDRWAMGELSDADLGLDKQHGVYSCPNGSDCPLCIAKDAAINRFEDIHVECDPDCNCEACRKMQQYNEQQELNPMARG